jgi:hypothetical protein
VIGELSAGQRHDITVSSPGYRPWSRAVELSAGEVIAIPDVELERIETGFALSTEPAGATVFVDDKPLAERTPLRVINLTSGAHHVRVENPGWSPWESVLQVKEGVVLPLPVVSLQPVVVPRVDPAASSNAQQVQVRSTNASDKPDKTADELAGPAATSSGDNGTLRVNSRPWSKVFVDGKPYGNTPRFNIELPAGSHKLELVNDEFKISRSVAVTITQGKVETLVINLLE